MTRNTKTPHLHERLGLTFQQLGALLAVREMLKLNVLEYASFKKAYGPAVDTVGSAHVFNMNIMCRVNEHCGSVGCIGGSMALFLGLPTDVGQRYVEQAKGRLGELFYPKLASGLTPDYDRITAAQAVRAINNFIAGKPAWQGIKIYPLS